MSTIELYGSTAIPFSDWSEISFLPTINWIAVEFSFFTINPSLWSYVIFRRKFWINGMTVYDEDFKLYPSSKNYLYHFKTLDITLNTTTTCNLEFRKFPNHKNQGIDDNYAVNIYIINP